MRKFTAKRSLLLTLTVLAVIAMAGAAVSAQTFVTIATGGTAGVYYPLGGAMAQIINDNVSGVSATAQSTGASVANVALLHQGEVELALIQNDIGYYASTGTEMFADRAMPALRGVAVLYPETIQVVTLTQSGIDSIADLAGKRVAVGAPGSGTEANARQILAAHGMTYDDLGRADFLSFGEAAANLKDRVVDAAFLTAGYPTAAVSDVAASHSIKILEIGADAYEALVADYPFYAQVTIPGATYRGVPGDVTSVAVMAMLATSADVDEDAVYNMTRAIFTNLDVLGATHARGQSVSVEGALDGMPLELHPGAARFFNE